MKYLPARAAGILATSTPTPLPEHGLLAPRQASTTASSAISSDLSLTTVFSVPKDCFRRDYGIMLDGTISGQPSAFLGFSAARHTCYPPSYSLLELSTSLWYSPGVCPSGYARVSQQTDAADGQPDLTLAWCCPSSMAFSYDGTREYCSTFIATSTSVQSGTHTTNIPFSNFVGLQWPISVMWRSADLNAFDPPSAPILEPAHTGTGGNGQKTKTGAAGGEPVTSNSKKSTPTTAPASPTQTQSISHKQKDQLTVGAQVGIGIGIAVPCIALLGLGIWFYLYRKKGRRDDKAPRSPQSEGAGPFGGKAELAGQELRSMSGSAKEKAGHNVNAAELGPHEDALNEIDGLERVRGQQEPVELPGNELGELPDSNTQAAAGPQLPATHVSSDAPTATEGREAARSSSRDPLV